MIHINLTKTKVKQGLTTGNVARMLRIPQSTVIRLFERGGLTGHKNPVTGRLYIDRKSVEALAKELRIELPSKEQMEKDLKALKRKLTAVPVTQKEG